MRTYFTCQTARYKLDYLERGVDDPILYDHHCHSLYELTILLEGSICIVVEGQKYRLEKNQAIIVPPLFYHKNIADGSMDTYRRITVLFDISDVPSVIQHTIPTALGEPAFTVFDVYTRQVNQLRQCVIDNNPVYYEPLINSLVIQCLYQHATAKALAPKDEGENELLQAIVQYIEQHLSDNISLTDIVGHVGRSKSNICELFKNEMGIPIKQYIISKKLAKANLLIQNGATPTQAALQVGYENYSSFYRIYRKFYGAIPSDYGMDKPE